MTLEAFWPLIGFGGMILILLVGMVLKNRKIKYHFRLAGYGYMFCLELVMLFTSEGIYLPLLHGGLLLFWIGLAYKDIKSTQMFDREFAKIDKLKEECKANIAKLFYHRRN